MSGSLPIQSTVILLGPKEHFVLNGDFIMLGLVISGFHCIWQRYMYFVCSDCFLRSLDFPYCPQA